jgi:hypothetical protein
MTRTLWLVAVLIAGLTLPALSEDTTTKAAPGTVAPEAARTGNPYKMEDARKHLMQQGYTNVSELVKDASGKWVGSAMKDGKTVPVAVGVKGGVAN